MWYQPKSKKGIQDFRFKRALTLINTLAAWGVLIFGIFYGRDAVAVLAPPMVTLIIFLLGRNRSMILPDKADKRSMRPTRGNPQARGPRSRRKPN